MTFDPTKPCCYRNGESARILCTDRAGEGPIASMTRNGNVWFHYNDGTPTFRTDKAYDLINVPEVREPRRRTARQF